MRQELEQMRRLVEVQKKALLSLEKRLRALEDAPKAPPPPEGAAPEVAPVQPPGPPIAAPTPESPPERDVTEAEPETEPGEAEEPTKKEADPTRSLQAVAQEETGFFGGRFTIEPGVTYSRFDRSSVRLRGFLALDAIFLGNISIDQVESDVITADVTARAGITDNLQADVNIPYVYRESTFLSGGAGGAATSEVEASVNSKDLGDVSFGVTYRVFEEMGSWPDVVWNVRGRAPTGTDPWGIPLEEVEGSSGNLLVPTELPTGNGVWEVSTGLSILKTLDPAVIFGNIDYFHNFEQSFDDIDAAGGEQPGKVRLGDSIRFGLGLAYALNERLSLSLSYSQRFFQSTEIKFAGMEEFEEIIGSDANVGTMNVGVTFAATDAMTVVGNLGVGLTQDAPDLQFQMKFPFTF